MDMRRILIDATNAISMENIDALYTQQIKVDGCGTLHTLNLLGYKVKS